MKQQIKRVPHIKSDEKTNYNVEIADDFEYVASCPICEKRVLDISDVPKTPIRIRIKCPHCRKIIKIPFSGASP